jgi:hypothetical protein
MNLVFRNSTLCLYSWVPGILQNFD